MKLISLIEKVTELESQLKRCKSEGMSFTDLQTLKQSILTQIFLFANFLSQKLEILMFVPCKLVDGVWVVLEEPNPENKKYRMIVGEEKEDILDLHSFDSDLKEYQEAKSKCLFEIESYTKNIIKSTSWHEYRFAFTNGKYFDFEDDTIYNVECLCELEPTLTTEGENKFL